MVFQNRIFSKTLRKKSGRGSGTSSSGVLKKTGQSGVRSHFVTWPFLAQEQRRWFRSRPCPNLLLHYCNCVCITFCLLCRLPCKGRPSIGKNESHPHVGILFCLRTDATCSCEMLQTASIRLVHSIRTLRDLFFPQHHRNKNLGLSLRRIWALDEAINLRNLPTSLDMPNSMTAAIGAEMLYRK